MKVRALDSTVALLAATVLFATSCSDSTGPDTGGTPPPQEFPNTYPPIPRPATPDETIPDESEIYEAMAPIAGKAIDFAPYWTEGEFTWNVDIQTQYDRYIGGWMGDPPGDYWNGTAHSSSLTFEGGVVDLRNPTPFGTSWGDPHPRRVMFIDQGVELATPVNPDRDYVLFQFQSGYPDRRFDDALFGGYWTLAVDPAIGERSRQRAYYVAAMSCGQLEKPVYIKRERFWKRLPLGGDGNNLKSIRVDPGATFEVSYLRKQGTSYQDSYTFTRTLNAEVPIPYIGAKLGGSLSEAFGSQVTVTEETETTLTKTFTGQDGKTVIFSVWTSVERYSIVHENGDAYTDPSFTFSDLGNAEIQGEYEWISSTAFDYR
ncbi:MAG TPA: hypothetical protein VFU38_03835 [Candidatus Krumholzibacteria bacterium]|nr:hypothetical protein [Candidatus Krumholzibacteria bacterium]